MKLIITADDFGASPLLDDGIIMAFEAGVLSQAGLLTENAHSFLTTNHSTHLKKTHTKECSKRFNSLVIFP